MDRDTAARLYNLMAEGNPVGVGGDGEIVSAPTLLSSTLHALGKPTYISRQALPGNKTIDRTLPNGVTYKDRYDWDTKKVVSFLREWADALEGNNADI